MPFEGASIPAPIMAAKQGMRDVNLRGVTDTAQSLFKYVSGSMTGQGSGLLQPLTQAAQGAMQSSITHAAQSGQASTLGKGESWGAGQDTGTGGDSWMSTLAQSFTGGGGGGSAAGAGLAAAQSMLGQSSGALGSAAALAGSGLGSGSGAGSGGGAGGALASMGSSIASAGAGAMGGSGGVSMPFSGLAPGTKPTPPQFNALPDIPSMPRLQDVVAQLGSLAGPAAPLLGALTGGGGGDDTGSGMVQQPANQFAGQGSAADYRANS